MSESAPVTIRTGNPRAPGTDPALPWRRRAAWHRRTALLPLGYLAAAVVVGLLALAGFPVTWLLLHLLLLGAVTNAIVVWSTHFTAAILRAPAADRRLPEAARLTALNIGILAVLVGGSTGLALLGLTGAILVFVAITAHLAGLAVMAHRALPARFTVLVWYYLAAGMALLTGIPAGAWMLTVPDRQRPRILLFHVQVNVFGWVMLTVLGTLITLWPTVLRTQVADGATRDARRGLIASSAGLIMLGSGAAWWLRPLVAVGLAAVVVGVVIALRPAVIAVRKRPPVTFAALSIAAGTCWMLVTLGWDGWALLSARDPSAAMGSLDLLAVAVAVGGGPAMVRRNASHLDRHRWSRVVAANAGLIVLLWPPAAAARVAGAVLAAAAAAMFLVPAAAVALRSRNAIDDRQARSR